MQSMTGHDEWYFAYGSNMSVAQKTDRTGGIRQSARAVLKGYRLAFNKLSDDETGKANVVQDDQSEVWGVLYLCNQRAIKSLDLDEGVHSGHYYRTHTDVYTDSNEKILAWIYIACKDRIREGLPVKRSYLERILCGAEEHKLPENYVENIRNITSRVNGD